MATLKERVLKEIIPVGKKWQFTELFELLKIDDKKINKISLRTCVAREIVGAGLAKVIDKKGRFNIYETTKIPTDYHPHAAPHSVADLLLADLINHLNCGFNHTTAGQAAARLRNVHGRKNIKRGTIYSYFGSTLLNRGIVRDTGRKTGGAREYEIIAKAEDIINLYYDFDPPEKAKSDKPVEEPEDEIDAQTFGERIFRYWRLMEDKVNALESEGKEEREKLHKVIRGLQDELDNVRKKYAEAVDRAKGKVSAGAYQELKNENDRLKKQLDEQNDRIKAMANARGSKFKLGDIARLTTDG